MFAEYEKAYPELAKEYKAAMKGELVDLASNEDLFAFEKPMATRQTSAVVLNTLLNSLQKVKLTEYKSGRIYGEIIQ